MATTTAALFYRGAPTYGASTVTRAITTAALTSNLVTITLGSNHGLSQVGTIVNIQGVGTAYDGVYPIHSYPGNNSFTYVKTNANIASAGVTPNAVAAFNTGITVGGSISNQAVVNFVATISTSSAHGLQVGDMVAVNTGTTGTEVTCAIVTGIPSSTIFTYNASVQSLTSVAVSQGAFGEWPVTYTVPSSTQAVLTNMVFNNTSLVAPTNFYVTVNGIAVLNNLTVGANTSTIVDLRQLMPTTGDKLVVGATTSYGVATVSGITVA
jgi:hypothetical protein